MIRVLRNIRDRHARERLWANISGIAALLVLLLIVLSACAACKGKTSGCPPFPFSYEPLP